MESRLLMSYTLSNIGNLPSNGQQQLESSGLVVDAQGNLYGTTVEGGTNGDGSVFEIAVGSNTVTTLASFASGTGEFPETGLAIDSSGNLYGVTDTGGTASHGTIFEITAGTSTITTLASFTSSSGFYPQPGASMIVDSSGNLFGTTEYGGTNNTGTVFELAASANTITPLASFSSSTTGKNSDVPLTIDASGNLYGTTQSGGANSDGTVFELLANSNTITSLASFTSSEGSQTSVIVDSSGNVYGTTLMAGSSSVGSVFKITQGSGVITTLATFNTVNGSYPEGTIVADSSGNIYGSTEAGGSSSVGSVFEYALGSNAITTLAAPNGSTTGAYLSYGVAMDSQGNLYGVSADGGANSTGLIYQATPPVTQAVVTGQPATVTCNTPQTISVSLETAFGYADTSDTALVSLSIASGPAGATITGTTSVNATAGVANFANISFSEAGTYTLTASSSGLTSATSSTFVIYAPYDMTNLITFNSSSGTRPVGNLVMDSAGNFYGVTQNAPGNSYGTVFEIAAGTGAVTTLATFTSGDSEGSQPRSGLAIDSNGNLYGVTSNGGANGLGAVYEVNPATDTMTTLAAFSQYTTGYQPNGPLLVGTNGDLYGTCQSGGASNGGTVFQVNPVTSTISILVSLSQNGGDRPAAGLITDANGNLFGTANEGGSDNAGAVFEVDASNGAFTTLASFTQSTGYQPQSGLVMDASGNLYGAASAGGANNLGSIYEVDQATDAITALAYFSQSQGYRPSSTLILDASGNLFGTAPNGGPHNNGTLFEVPANSGTIVALAPFITGEYLPSSGIQGSDTGAVTDIAGTLYGTVIGGPNGYGAIFEAYSPATAVVVSSQPTTVVAGTLQSVGVTLDNASATVANYDTATVTLSIASGPVGGTMTGTTSVSAVAGIANFTNLTFSEPGTYTLSVASNGLVSAVTQSFTVTPAYNIADLADLNGTSGVTPIAGLYADGSGNLYGTTSSGGAHNDGTVFEVSAATHALTTLVSFNGTNGLSPLGSVIADSSGNLYGTTSGGGINNEGTVFEIASGTGTLTTIASFNYNSNGGVPEGGLLIDGSGNLYGVADYGGANHYGTIFKIVHGSNAITTLAAFTFADGSAPSGGGLVMDSSGNLYGTAEIGGANSDGDVWELPFNSNTITPLAAFNGTNGENPCGNLVMDSAGNLYGTTSAGGANNDGSVFEVAFGTGTITTLVALSAATGAAPLNGPVMDSSGDLFVATIGGSGVTGDGTIIEIPAGSDTANVLVDLSTINSNEPQGRLILDAQGNLYDTARAGGANGHGSVFEVAPSAANHAAITSYATSTIAGSSQTITVSLESVLGFVDASNNATVTLAIASGPSGATLGGTLSAPAINGVATFSGLTFSAAGNYILAVASAFPVTTTSSITVTAASFNNIQFVQQPADTVAGQNITQVSVALEDAYGNLIANNVTGTVQVELVANGNETLLGTTSTSIVSGGEESFANLAIDIADTGDYLIATTSLGSATATSGDFDITPAAASTLAFINQPGSTTAGQTIAPIQVAVEDEYGNLVPTDNSTVAVQASPMVLNGAVSASVVNGIASFNQLYVLHAGTYTITAGDSNLASAVSGSFTVTPATAAQMFFTQQPAGTTAGHTIAPVQVQVEDAFGNRVANTTSVSLQTTGTHALDGSISALTFNGLATFNQLNITRAGVYTIVASAENITSAASNSFSIIPGTASKLVVSQAPVSTTAGAALGNIAVNIEDSFGNLVTTSQSPVTITEAPVGIVSSGPVLNGTSTVTAQNGVAIFSNLSLTLGGTYDLTAEASALAPVTTAAIAVANIVPHQVAAGVAFAPVTISKTSAFGQLVAKSKSLSVVVENQSTGAVVLTKKMPLVRGAAVIKNLATHTAGNYIVMISDGQGHTMTQTFTVKPSQATRLVFASQPVFTNGNATVAVDVEDRYGNIVSSAQGTKVSLQMTGTAALSPQTITATVRNGVAVFSTVTIGKHGRGRLRATSRGLASVQSGLLAG